MTMFRFLDPLQVLDLKALLDCEIYVKGETPLAEYRKAIQRYNTVFIKRAVCTTMLPTIERG